MGLGVAASRGLLNALQPADDFKLKDPKTGIRLMVGSNSELPMLKVLLPGQPESDRGIEIEFPEHAWGRVRYTKQVRRFYLITSRESEFQAQPRWRRDGNSLSCKMSLPSGVGLSATARLEPDGVRMTHRFQNNTETDFEEVQAPTCVKLYSAFYDLFLERTYVHHKEGFDLLASETPERLKMKKEEWLPCRYLVPFTLPVVPLARRAEKKEDGITWRHKRRQVDAPFIATVSQNGQWVAATHTMQTPNVWTNPERTCHHADPYAALGPRASATISLKLFLFRGSLEDAWKKISEERRRA